MCLTDTVIMMNLYSVRAKLAAQHVVSLVEDPFWVVRKRWHLLLILSDLFNWSAAVILKYREKN